MQVSIKRDNGMLKVDINGKLCIEDENIVKYACFEDGSMAIADTPRGNSIYAAVPFIPSDILRDMLRRSGVFLYGTDPRVYTYVNEDAVCVYNATNGNAEILVRDNDVYSDMLTGEEFCAQNGKVELPKRDIREYLLTKRY